MQTLCKIREHSGAAFWIATLLRGTSQSHSSRAVGGEARQTVRSSLKARPAEAFHSSTVPQPRARVRSRARLLYGLRCQPAIMSSGSGGIISRISARSSSRAVAAGIHSSCGSCWMSVSLRPSAAPIDVCDLHRKLPRFVRALGRGLWMLPEDAVIALALGHLAALRLRFSTAVLIRCECGRRRDPEPDYFAGDGGAALKNFASNPSAQSRCGLLCAGLA